MPHPYVKFERTALWSAVEAAIVGLVENSDLAITTPPQYVVGSICQALVHSRVVTPDAVTRLPVVDQ